MFCEIFNVNFQGTWYVKVKSVNKDEQTATLILDMSRCHMIKWLAHMTPSKGASENLSAKSKGSVFQVLEGFVYYVEPTTSSNAMNAFVGSKESVRIPFTIGKALLLAGICKARSRTWRQWNIHISSSKSEIKPFLNSPPRLLRQEAKKRGLRSGTDIKLCHLQKGLDGCKAYAINILFLHISTTLKACK